MENIEIRCLNYNSEDVIKCGFIKTNVVGKGQRYFCKSCNKKFIPKDAFYRMRNNS